MTEVRRCIFFSNSLIMFTWLYDLFHKRTEPESEYCYILFGAKGPVDDPEHSYPVAIFNNYEMALEVKNQTNNNAAHTTLHIQYIIPCKLNTVHVIQNLLYGNI